jgi:oligopeptide/dipeptide ABC transporter ATP-binding protein
MIFQDPYASVNPRMRIGDIVAEPLVIFGMGSAAERRQTTIEVLAEVGIPESHLDRYPHEFSGGQLQRIGIARALVTKPKFIVLDEPVSALDVSIQAQILNLLADLQHRHGLTYLVVAHDLGVVRHVSDRIAVMYLGKIVELADRDPLYRRPLHPYTAALLSAVPVPDPDVEKGRRRIILKGDLPSPASPPAGCRFHTRCWLRERLANPDICHREAPPLRVIDGSDAAACHFAEKMATGEVPWREAE